MPRTTTVLGTVWMKGNAILSENRRVQFGDQAVMINKTMESDAGYYTCCVKTIFGSWNKTAYLTVIESEEEENDGKFVHMGEFKIHGSAAISTLKRSEINHKNEFLMVVLCTSTRTNVSSYLKTARAIFAVNRTFKKLVSPLLKRRDNA